MLNRARGPRTTWAAALQARSYLQEVAPWLARYGQALATLSRLAQNPRLDDEDWARGLAVQLATIRSVRGKLAAVKAVPKELQEIHAALLEASGDLDRAANALAAAVARQDAGAWQEAAGLMATGSEKLRRGTALMDAHLSRIK